MTFSRSGQSHAVLIGDLLRSDMRGPATPRSITHDTINTKVLLLLQIHDKRLSVHFLKLYPVQGDPNKSDRRSN